MLRSRAVLPAVAVGTLLSLTASASAAVTAAGSATSTATLVSVSAAGRSVALGTLSAVAQTLDGAAPSVTFVPVTVDGVATGAVTVDPASSPRTVGGMATPGVPAGVISATSPSATLRAAQDAAGKTSGIDAKLGSVSVLGLPVTISGGATVGSATGATRSQAGKQVSIGKVALPSVGALLSALGVDLSALPASTLESLLTDLPITLSDTAQAATDAVLTQLATASDGLAAAEDAFDDKQDELATAAGAANSTRSAFLSALAAIPMSEDTFNGLLDAAKALTPAYDEYTAWTAAEDALGTAQGAVTAAATEVAAKLGTVTDAVEALAGLVATVLDATPIAEIGSADVTMLAFAGATKKADFTGQVSGLKVLNTDLLDAVLGNSTLDVAGLTATVTDTVNGAIAEVTEALSGILSEATGAVGLVIPAPTLTVLQGTKKTGTDGAFNTADVGVSLLEFSLGSATIPTGLALPNAAALPGITQSGSTLRTSPMSIKVGTLGEAARFRPAVASGTTPGQGTTTPGRNLPSTGAEAWLSVVGLIAIAGATGLRRFRRTAVDAA